MLSRWVGRLARARRDPASPLRELAPLLRAADIAFVNLEAPFSDRGRPVERGMIFKAEPEMIGALELAGIDVVSTANNHARDCSRYGVEFTLDWLGKHGIAAAGSGKTGDAAHAGTILTRNGLRFGFLRAGFAGAEFCHASVIASPSDSSSTAPRVTRVQPWRPHAPFSGANASGCSWTKRRCWSGVSLTIPVLPSPCSVAKILPFARKSG